jgi:hypothetical protein
MAGIMSTLSDLEGAANKMLDINTLMKAFESYVQKVNSGCTVGDDGSKSSVGVPINYFLKHISKAHVSAMYKSKYYPPSLEDLMGDLGLGGMKDKFDALTNKAMGAVDKAVDKIKDK